MSGFVGAILRERAMRHYPHRVMADPDTCPVCCGDKKTTDRAFQIGPVLYYPMPDQKHITVRECAACKEFTT